MGFMLCTTRTSLRGPGMAIAVEWHDGRLKTE